MIRGIALDLEGTIINLEPVHFRSFARAIQSMGLGYLNLESAEAFEYKIPGSIGGGDLFIATRISELCGGSVDIASILACKNRFYEQEIRKSPDIVVRDGFLDIFFLLKMCGLPMAIASLTSPEKAQILLERTNLTQYFSEDYILLGDSVRKVKPAPDIYLEVASRFAISPAELLVFEDSLTGVRSAVVAKCPCIAMPVFTFEENIRHIAEAGACSIFFSWEDVGLHECLFALFGRF